MERGHPPCLSLSPMALNRVIAGGLDLSLQVGGTDPSNPIGLPVDITDSDPT